MSEEYHVFDFASMKKQIGAENVSASVNICTITPEIAERILRECNYPRNRTITQRKVKDLAYAMEDGTFIPWTTTLNFSPNNNELNLTDGQHRLSALVKSGKSYHFPIMITPDSADIIYPRTDRGLTRSLKDAIRAGGYDHLMNMSETATKQAATGLKVLLEGYTIASSGRKVSETVLLDTLTTKYYTQCHRIFEMTGNNNDSRKLVGRIPMALWLVLYTELAENELKKVDEFIYGCATAIREDEGDPRFKVYEKYKSTQRSGASVLRKMSRSEELGLLLVAWEYWYIGKKARNRFDVRVVQRVLRDRPNIKGTDKSLLRTYVSSS